MSTTIENLGLSLEPIAAVDVSTASTGFTMFRLTLTAQNEGVLENIVKSLFQVEYWISEIGKLEPIENGNGFLSIENNVSQISTLDSSTNTVSFNVAVPSLSNEILDNIEVKLRIYVGLTSEPSIHVSVWSGSVPLYNPPKQPQIKNAFLFRGEDPHYYYNDDSLYVQIENEEDFDTDNISFVVSYNYKDQEGTFKWEVSSLLQGNRIQFPQKTYTILVGPIMLPTDVFGTTDLFVAVNAVFNYDIEDTQYYTVSEISATIPTEDAVSVAPVLDKIETNDYLVYNDKTTQQINLHWTPASSSVIPDLAIVDYTARIFMDGVLQENLTNNANDLTAQFNVGNIVKDNGAVLFTFDVTANYISGQKQTSEKVSINSFTFSEPVQDLLSIWANNGVDNNKVDIALRFNNPSTIGLGTPVENNGILVRVDGSVEILFDYVPGDLHYLKYLSNLEVNPNGTIEVFVLTQDTNFDEEKLEGKVATTNYTVDNLPTIKNVVYDNDALVFDVVTTSPLVLINRLNMLVDGELKSIELPADVENSIVGLIVEQQTISTGDDLWKFEISTDYIREQVGSGQINPSPIGILMSNVGRGVAFHPAILEQI